MLISSLLPLLGSFRSPSISPAAGADDVVTLIIVPRIAEGKRIKSRPRPASCVRSRSQRLAAEIDAGASSSGADGALGGLDCRAQDAR